MAIIAPHPFYPGPACLGENIIKYGDVFDAFEYCYTKLINPFNKKMLKQAKKQNKPVIGTSDVHSINSDWNTFSVINSKKEEKSIIDAIKTGKVECVSKPISLKQIFQIIFSHSGYLEKILFSKRTK